MSARSSCASCTAGESQRCYDLWWFCKGFNATPNNGNRGPALMGSTSILAAQRVFGGEGRLCAEHLIKAFKCHLNNYF